MNACEFFFVAIKVVKDDLVLMYKIYLLFDVSSLC